MPTRESIADARAHHDLAKLDLASWAGWEATRARHPVQESSGAGTNSAPPLCPKRSIRIVIC